jgi:hypothetical protein
MCAAVAVVGALVGPVDAAGVAVFVDANNNGVFDSGDVDVTETVRAGLPVETPESIVVREGTSVRVRASSVTLVAGKAIHVGGALMTTGSMALRTETGPITLGPRSLLTSDAVLQVTAGGDLVVERARVQADDVVMLEALGGRLAVTYAALNGGTRVDLNGYAADGDLVMERVTVQSPRGLVNVHVAGRADLHQVTGVARNVNISVGGGLAEITSSTLRVPRGGMIFITVESPDATPSTLDLTRSRVLAVGDAVVLTADQIVGQ